MRSGTLCAHAHQVRSIGVQSSTGTRDSKGRHQCTRPQPTGAPVMDVCHECAHGLCPMDVCHECAHGLCPMDVCHKCAHSLRPSSLSMLIDAHGLLMATHGCQHADAQPQAKMKGERGCRCAEVNETQTYARVQTATAQPSQQGHQQSRPSALWCAPSAQHDPERPLY